MSESLILYKVEQGIARITLNRPSQCNALTRAMIVDLTKTLHAVIANDQVRLIVVTAAGPVFCAGMDLAEMQQRAEQGSSEEDWRQDSRVYRDLLVTLLDAPQPTLAVVQGPVLAGGVGIVLACDLVVATDTAFFSLPEPQRGITASMVTPLLGYRCGAGHASQLLLSGQRIPAASMNAAGVCHQVVAADQLVQVASKLSQSILTGSPTALAATKAQLRAAIGADLTSQIDQAVGLSAAARRTPDAQEGMQAFLEKRDPRWNIR